MSGEALDLRVHAARPDLADARLEGRVTAQRFVAGEPGVASRPTVALRGAPDAARMITATLLLGEPVRVFERLAGWAWAQSEIDGYVGYAEAEALAAPGPKPTHRVSTPRAHLYPAADLKRPPLDWAPLGARVAVDASTPETDGFRRLAGAAERWVYAKHLAPLDAPARDWVSVAEQLLGAPYGWGGDSVEGVDCSGLIQTALECAGRACPRDSDQQEAALGTAIDPDTALTRGDLIFWKGHVGVMRDAERLLHANAWAMAVASEPLRVARARIEAAGWGPVTSARRL